jgi:hypothetical protein
MTMNAVANACVSLFRQWKFNEVMEWFLSMDIVRVSLYTRASEARRPE